MDFINQATGQVTDLFRSMTVGARITAGLLLVVVVVSLGYLFNQQSSGPDDFLMNGEPIAASELPAMEAAFSRANLTDYRVDGARIRIPRGQSSAYMGALADDDALPMNFDDYLTKVVEDSSPFVSKSQRETRLRNAKQQQLQAIIRSMKDIDKAMVIYDEQKKSGLRGEKVLTASVSVKSVGNKSLDPARVNSLRSLVAGAIAGLDPKMVSVTDLNSGKNFPAETEGATSSMNDPYATRKRDYENLWTEKIETSLEYVPGISVAVNVELYPELKSSTQQKDLTGKPFIARSKTDSNLKSQKRGGPQGRPGPASNRAQGGGPASGGATVLGGSDVNLSEEENSEFVEGIPGTEVVASKTLAGLIPKKVKVSLGVPSTYVEKIWRKANPDKGDPTVAMLGPTSKEITTNLRKHIALLVPIIEGDASDTRDDITVTVFEDVAEEVIIPEESTSDAAFSWFGKNLSTVSMSLVAVFGLVMLRSMVRSTPPPVASSSASVAEVSMSGDSEPSILSMHLDENASEEEKVAHQKQLKRRLSSGPSVKDELADMVKEDPEAAANILRSWIGNAG